MSEKLIVKFTKLKPEATIPVYKTKGAVAADICTIQTYTINPGETVFLSSGIAIAVPEGYMGILAPRGSLCIKNGLHMPHSMGIFDADYRGEVIIPLRNASDKAVEILKGERIAQFTFVPVALAEFIEVDQLDETERGDGRFGSTGRL